MIEKLAEDAFIKREILQNMMMQNTPLDYDERKKAFVQLALARDAAAKARADLDARINE